MKKQILKAENIHKTFHHPVKAQILKGVDFEVFEGETVAIMGRSGEGKSTLLNILGTLDNSCNGKLEIAGCAVSHRNKTSIRNRHVGFVFQSFHLLEDYTALENILMPMRIARHSVSKGSEGYRKGIRLLEYVGLSDRAHFNAKQLSGGEKQRVAIARALCNDPDIIYADEPSGNLDRQTAELIHNLLIDFAKGSGKALVVVTHDQELARLCDTQYHLCDGKLSSI